MATPRLVAAIHVLRVSGPFAARFLKRTCGLDDPRPRELTLVTFRSGREVVDRVLAAYFPAPRSYTGEEMVEIHCHGSLAVVDEILRAGLSAGLRLAEPGEFTRRAFLNGKLSAEQAEAVDVLIRSRSDFMRRNALRILEKKTSLKFTEMKKDLLDILSILETSIEFPEDHADEAFAFRKRIVARFRAEAERIRSRFSRLSEQFDKGARLDEGVRVALVGRPNAGKSTLMNALLRQDRVLVSPLAGTTRDWVKEEIRLEGIPVLLHDTAGLREDAEVLEKEGIAKTLEIAGEMDLGVFLAWEPACVEVYRALRPRLPSSCFVLLGKDDLRSKTETRSLIDAFASAGGSDALSVSLLDASDALPAIEERLLREIRARFTLDPNGAALLSERQRTVVSKILDGLAQVDEALASGQGEEIVVEELHGLRTHFDELDLSWDHEEVFDHLFSRFCIGK